MSINSLANAAAARRHDTLPIGKHPGSLSQIAAASSRAPRLDGQGGERHDGDQQNGGGVDTTMNVLFGYIPTEVLTLYVAVRAALEQNQDPTSGLTSFWIFLFATPLIVWLVFGAKLKALNKAVTDQATSVADLGNVGGDSRLRGLGFRTTAVTVCRTLVVFGRSIGLGRTGDFNNTWTDSAILSAIAG